MSAQIGRRYRINDMAHEWDGAICRLERIEGAVGYVMRGETVKRVALCTLSDRGVLQSVGEPVERSHYTRVFEVLSNPTV